MGAVLELEGEFQHVAVALARVDGRRLARGVEPGRQIGPLASSERGSPKRGLAERFDLAMGISAAEDAVNRDAERIEIGGLVAGARRRTVPAPYSSACRVRPRREILETRRAADAEIDQPQAAVASSSITLSGFMSR